MSALIVTTAGGDILGVVLTGTKHESIVRRDVESFIREEAGGDDPIEYNPEEIEYTTTDRDGDQVTFYIQEVRAI